jgi:hypothetical protein
MEGAHFENLGVDENVIIKRILKKWDRKMWTGFM